MVYPSMNTGGISFADCKSVAMRQWPLQTKFESREPQNSSWAVNFDDGIFVL